MKSLPSKHGHRIKVVAYISLKFSLNWEGWLVLCWVEIYMHHLNSKALIVCSNNIMGSYPWCKSFPPLMCIWEYTKNLIKIACLNPYYWICSSVKWECWFIISSLQRAHKTTDKKKPILFFLLVIVIFKLFNFSQK